MPLLKKNTFEKATAPELLRDEEEVFYCAITNEIFRDYEDFSERMFLCNSMVWTCSFTGKSNLTYQEALESEEAAKKSLKEFPSELKLPILYLASKTKRTSFGEMAEDVFMYARDRYFIGENLESSFTGKKWKDSHVLQVLAPSEEQIRNAPKNGDVGDRHFKPPASLYKYEIEHLDADDEDISEIMIVDCNQIRRKGRLFSREKCKLFLKQYVEQDDRGLFAIKKTTIDDFNLTRVTFDQIFDGPPPAFGASKNGKKTRQESLHKFLTKSTSSSTNGNNANLLERMQERVKLIKQRKKEEAEALKQKRKEENLLIAVQLKDWYRPKEDLELIDQQKLPIPTPVKCKVPDEHVGEMLMVLEFVSSFSKLLSTKDFFPGGVTVEIMERALTEPEVAGPYIDLIQMFLSAIFNAQEDEIAQYKSQIQAHSNIKEETISNNMSLREATQLATLAASWSNKYQGLALNRLPLYSLTTSEVLRLHLLSSGANINLTGARWRYQQRGGYTSEDDPGLYLRLHEPQILKSLAVHNVVELPMTDKLKILTCLVDQMLTYADVRDVVEERLEDVKQAKVDHRIALSAERKREHEYLSAKFKLKKEDKENPKLQQELNKLEAENDRRKSDNEHKIDKLLKKSYSHAVLMGQDRAFRQYLKLDSVPGFFVNFDEQNSGTCLGGVVKQNTDLVNASRDDTLAHLKRMVGEVNSNSSSDKENSPSKSPKKVNGVHNSLLDPTGDQCDELMMCSADFDSCIVHSDSRQKQKWSFYHKTEDLIQLTGCLNVRGLRESELQLSLKSNREQLETVIEDTPVTSLNCDIEDTEEVNNKKSNKRLNSKMKYEDANLGYATDLGCPEVLQSVLIENILEMEEKIFAGNLGRLILKDRDGWRNSLQSRDYKHLIRTISRRSENGRAATPDPVESLEKYQDPGQYILGTDDLLAEDESQEAVGALAVALAQTARSVEKRYLKKPLGKQHPGKNGSKKDSMLDQWQQSLLASTSFSQVFLHYSTLDSCVMWARSALLARCRICRRQKDSENMLLCDSCNLGHHLYCLKPKLKAVPVGDWFCGKCEKERKKEEEAATPAKKRHIFRDDEESDTEVKSGTSDPETGEIDEDIDEDAEDALVPVKVELCKTCGSGGEVINCDKCAENYHIECVEPPLRRAPRGPWTCHNCKRGDERRVIYDRSCLSDSVVRSTAVMNGQRRCATKALCKIHDFAKNLRRISESDSDSDSNDEVISKRTSRRDEGRSDLPLHNAALHEVLAEVMKDDDCWPFLRPVQKNDVPDYYDVITQPMDFGTIKYKLNMGEYTIDAQVMADAVLVFQNCNTYNHTEDEVYKCGVRLLKHFQKKCREVGLKLPEEMDYGEESNGRPKKKQRTK